MLWVEAAKYQVLPLDTSVAARMIAPRPSLTAGRNERSLTTGALTGIPHGDAPSLLDKSYTIAAEVEIPAGGAEGMLLTEGGRFGGFGFYLLTGKPVFVWNLLDLERVRWEGAEALAPGKHTLTFDFKYDGLGPATGLIAGIAARAKGGTGIMKVDGREVANKKMAALDSRSLCNGTRRSTSARTPARRSTIRDYQVPFEFTGKLSKLTVTLDPPKPGQAPTKKAPSR